MRRIVFLFCIGFIFSACTKEPEQDIPEVFKEYVDLFFEEGKKRGFETTLEDVNLSFEFDDLSSRRAAGLCTFSSGRVRIDREFWDNSLYLARRRIIFHELGHCVLQRRHRLESTVNDQCLSIMGVKEGNFNCSKNVYSDKWWNYYLDELFDENTVLPDWYTDYEDYKSIDVISNLFTLDTSNASFEFDEIDFSTLHNFSIDILFESYETEHISVNIWLGNIGFRHCDVCSGTNVRISGGNPRRVYFNNFNGNIVFDSDIKLSIRRINETYYFYVNERFIDILDNNLVSGSKIRTLFDTPIQYQVEINELE